MTDDKELLDCPIPDCNYQALSEQALKGHWGGMRDDDHTGRWHEAYKAAESPQEAPEQRPSQPSGESGPAGGKGESGAARGAQSQAQARTQEPDGGASVSSDGSGIVPSEERHDRGSEHKSKAQCCEAPSLEGGAGDVYRLEDETFVRLEDGDEICVECDTIHE